jgi:hypothetical protein
MHLTLTPDVLNTFADQLADNPKIAQTLAQHFLANSDKLAMANYLLADGVAFELLTQRLQEKPKRTLAEVATLGQVPVKGRRSRPKKVRPKARRQRLATEQSNELKQQVVVFLKANPGSTRKQIGEAVSFPSAAVYNRIIGELKAGGVVVQKGKRGKAVYGVKAG